MTPQIRVTLYDSFEDHGLEAAWEQASSRRDTDVFMTLGWQRAWWRAYGRGRLMILGAERAGLTEAIAPFFLDGEMVFLVGSGGSDRLDLVGGVTSEVTARLLDAAITLAPQLLGIRLYHLPAESPTLDSLRVASRELRLTITDEGSLQDPVLDLQSDGLEAAKKKSFVRCDRALARDGSLRLLDLREYEEAKSWLEAFYAQHAARWRALGHMSPFVADSRSKTFFNELAREGAASGWLRFLVLLWDEQPIAFHFGTRYANTYTYYKPSFDVGLARKSPGDVMLRRLILAALDETALLLDLGIGDEPYKRRFTSTIRVVRTVGLYPIGQTAGN